MNRKIEIAHILKTLEKIAKKENKDLSFDTIYYYLTRGMVNSDSKGRNPKEYFSKFINYFKNISNIVVFVQSDWKYFCQFVNLPHGKNELDNAIKMYLCVDYNNIYEVATNLFLFMAKNNIIHKSKIGSEVRTDDIVIRLYSKEDEKRTREYIKNNPFIKKKLLKTTPFAIQKDGIGYAMDGDLSYNVTVSKYIKEYINYCRHNNTSVSYKGFYEFIYKLYNEVFIQKQGIKKYWETFIDEASYTSSNGYLLNNYFEVTYLILLSLNSNSFENYLSFVDFCNDKQEFTKRVHSFEFIEEITLDEIKLFKEYILTMYQKYGEELSFSFIHEYLNTGNILSVTRDHNLRQRFMDLMSPYKCMKILKNLSLEEYFFNTIKDQDLYLKKKYLDMAIIITYNKYGLEQAVKAVLDLINSSNYDYFTNDLNARINLQNNVDRDICLKIINQYASNYLEYVKDCVDKYEKGKKK